METRQETVTLTIPSKEWMTSNGNRLHWTQVAEADREVLKMIRLKGTETAPNGATPFRGLIHSLEKVRRG